FTNGVTLNNGIITVPVGVTTFTAVLPTNDDSEVEPTETVILNVDGVTATGSIEDNDKPTNTRPDQLSASNSTVSEEGLDNALADNDGNPVDTGDNKTATGTLSFVDNDDISGESFEFMLDGPSGISSGSDDIEWQWDAINGVLTGTTENSNVIVATITLGDVQTNGSTHTVGYTVNLLAPIDHEIGEQENTLDLVFSYSVSDGVNQPTIDTFVVNVEDDSPEAFDTVVNVERPEVDTNLMVVLDISGSMNVDADGDSSTSETRLDLAKEAIINLVNKYDDLGDVMVRIVTFSTLASEGTAAWLPASEVASYLNQVNAGGWTNYDAALAVAQDAFEDDGKLSDAQNVSYFLSDGAPTASDGNKSTLTNNSVSPGYTSNNSGTSGDHGINNAEEAIWTDFLKANDINSIALAIGSGISSSDLDPIAYNGSSHNSGESHAISVTDITQLDDVLSDNVFFTPITGSLLQSSLITDISGFGADGGYLKDVSINMVIAGVNTLVTYNYDPIANVITNNANNTVIDGSTLTATTATLASLSIDLSTGDYSYQLNYDGNSGALTETVGFTLIDGDGDTSAAELKFNVTDNNVSINHDPAAKDDNGAVSQTGLASEYYAYQEGTDGSNLTRVAQVAKFVAENEADATFIARDINYNLASGNLAGDNDTSDGLTNLEKFLGDDAQSLSVDDPALGTDAILSLNGLIELSAGTYKFKVNADDGYQILIDGKQVAIVDRIQSPTITGHAAFTINTSGFHKIEILYWDQAGAYVFEPKLSKDDGTYLELTSTNFNIKNGYQTDEDQAFRVSVAELLLNDTDEDGDTLSITEVSNGVNGTAALDGNGNIVFTPNADYVGEASYQYTVSDGNGGTDTATVSLTVTPAVAVGSTLVGTNDDDELFAGLGEDVLTGKKGADTFTFTDTGDNANAFETDIITDFDIDKKDKLDLTDLLSGENKNNIDDYLNFEKVGNDTLINISKDGGFATGAAADQAILLQNVDLTDGNASDQQIIDELMKYNLLIDD
ncbi:cadherin-like domain-containing protein, partial [Gammaproteobacteria bacterium AS21]